MKHLYFVRHGESVLNKKRVFSGQIDTPLTDKGRSQAKQAGVLAKNYSFDLIVSSPLSRALETAKLIAAAIGYPIDKIIIRDIFKERYHGQLEGKSWDEYDEKPTPANGAETDADLLKRAEAGLEFLRQQSAGTILLVGHGSFYRLLRTALDPSRDYDEPPNSEIVQLI